MYMFDSSKADFHQRAFLGLFVMLFASLIALFECSRIWWEGGQGGAGWAGLGRVGRVRSVRTSVRGNGAIVGVSRWGVGPRTGPSANHCCLEHTPTALDHLPLPSTSAYHRTPPPPSTPSTPPSSRPLVYIETTFRKNVGFLYSHPLKAGFLIL